MNKNNTKMPSQEELSILMEHYQNGRFDEAERSARSLALQYPHDNFSWKILGAVLKQTDRKHDAVITGQKAVEINPNLANSHLNLGIVLRDLGKLTEAELSLNTAEVETLKDVDPPAVPKIAIQSSTIEVPPDV